MSIVKEILVKKIISANRKYPQLIEGVIKGEINENSLNSFDKNTLISFEKIIDIKIAEKETGITVPKMSRMIQESTSVGEIGLQALTKFTCKKCGKEEVHGSTAVPILCSRCAEDTAKRLLVKMYRIRY